MAEAKKAVNYSKPDFQNNMNKRTDISNKQKNHLY